MGRPDLAHATRRARALCHSREPRTPGRRMVASCESRRACTWPRLESRRRRFRCARHSRETRGCMTGTCVGRCACDRRVAFDGGCALAVRSPRARVERTPPAARGARVGRSRWAPVGAEVRRAIGCSRAGRRWPVCPRPSMWRPPSDPGHVRRRGNPPSDPWQRSTGKPPVERGASGRCGKPPPTGGCGGFGGAADRSCRKAGATGSPTGRRDRRAPERGPRRGGAWP